MTVVMKWNDVLPESWTILMQKNSAPLGIMSGQRDFVGESLLGKQGQVEVASEQQGRVVSGVFLRAVEWQGGVTSCNPIWPRQPDPYAFALNRRSRPVDRRHVLAPDRRCGRLMTAARDA